MKHTIFVTEGLEKLPEMRARYYILIKNVLRSKFVEFIGYCIGCLQTHSSGAT